MTQEIKQGTIIKVLVKTYSKHSINPVILTYTGEFLSQDKNFMIINDYQVGIIYLNLIDINQVTIQDGE